MQTGGWFLYLIQKGMWNFEIKRIQIQKKKKIKQPYQPHFELWQCATRFEKKINFCVLQKMV